MFFTSSIHKEDFGMTSRDKNPLVLFASNCRVLPTSLGQKSILTISVMLAMELHESILKYGDTDASDEIEYSCLTSSMHKSTYPPITKSDLDSHDSSGSLRIWIA